MNDIDAIALLNHLADTRDEEARYRAQYDALRDEILAAVAPQLASLDDEYKPTLEAFSDKIASLESNIKAQVLGVGATCKGDRLMGVYMAGRTSWDTKGLDGFAVAHPEIRTFRSTGEPTVQIRKKG